MAEDKTLKDITDEENAKKADEGEEEQEQKNADMADGGDGTGASANFEHSLDGLNEGEEGEQEGSKDKKPQKKKKENEDGNKGQKQNGQDNTGQQPKNNGGNAPKPSSGGGTTTPNGAGATGTGAGGTATTTGGTAATTGGTAATTGGTAATTGGTVAATGGTAAATGGTAAATGTTAAAAGGTAAATAGGAAAAATPVGWVILAIIVIILLIMIIMGFVSFFHNIPQFLFNRLKELGQSLWDGLQGYAIGLDKALVNEDDIIGVAQYLYDMGYDLVGMGFAESVEIYGQKDESGEEIKVEEGHVKDEIKKINAPYLRAYLVAENRTYLINNYTLLNTEGIIGSIFDGSFFGEGVEAWGTGLIDLDANLLENLGMSINYNIGELVKGVKIERETNTLRIRRLNTELNILDWHNDYTYFSLDGWSGRYGKPFELLLTMHLSTMAPDLVKEFAMNKDLDAKVHIKMTNTEFNGKVYVDGKSIDELEEAGTYPADTIKELRDLEKDRASEIKTVTPYISSVTNHWFRNVYFEGTNSEGASSSTEIGIDSNEDGIEDYNEPSGPKTQVTRKLTAKYDNDLYNFGEAKDIEIPYTPDDDNKIDGLGDEKITFRGKIDNGVVQTKDAVRGVTNPTTKKLFNEEYYIYDGTVAKAKAIQDARLSGDESLKEPIQFTKSSLNAFAMLERSETLDAQFIYRDLKELVIELGYFEREDFNAIERQVLEWPVPDYIPGEWPNRKTEKQVLEYGTLIAGKASIAKSLGMSVEDLNKLTGEDTKTDNNSTSNNTDELAVLKNCLFIGDSYITGLETNGGISGAQFRGMEKKTAQYWIQNIDKLPEQASKICIYLGVNNPSDHQSMKNLLDVLTKKYEGKQIYVIEVMHLGKNYNNVDSINSKIDTYNSHVREKCKTMPNVTFIDASQGLVSGGYLANPDSEGIHMKASEYPRWAKNIAREMNDKRHISHNETDEQFVVNFLSEAKKLSEYVKNNNFSYGNAEYMPPRAVGAENLEATTESGEKLISGDRFVAWALYNCGYKDQPESGLTVGESGKFIEYCESKEWKRIDSASDVQAGDIVFVGQLDDEGKKAQNVFICAGDGKRYDCGSNDKIKLTGSYSGYESQPLSATIDSNFMCAYRVTGTTSINSGFEADLDVLAMGNGKVVELLDAENNMFSPNALSGFVSGTDEKSEAIESTISDEGIRIKLTDNAVKGYTLIIYGFDVDENITPGQKLTSTEVIGKTTNSDMCLILLDRDRAIIEDIENYIKVPKKKKKSGTSLTGANAEEKVWIALRDAGYSEVATAAVMGNIYGESSFNPAVIEHGSGIGFGLCQWSYGRRTALENFANSRGVPPSDVDLQIEFLLAELQPGGGADGYADYQFSGFSSYRQTWMNTSSIPEATKAFCDGFERPSSPRYDVRTEAAQKYYSTYSNS